MRLSRSLILLCLPLVMGGTALAQTPDHSGAPGTSGLLGSLGGLGDLGGGLGGLARGLNPNAVGKGNAAGVLSYCVRNKLLRQQQDVASGLLGKLTGKEPAVESTRGFLDGQRGLLKQGGGGKLSLDSLPSGIRSQACDLILNKARSFL